MDVVHKYTKYSSQWIFGSACDGAPLIGRQSLGACTKLPKQQRPPLHSTETDPQILANCLRNGS